jgi:predicted site-specific integrase-resolvase
VWAKKNGVSYRTAWNWAKDNKMPVAYHRTPTGTILVDDDLVQNDTGVALYARVSSSDQHADLERQLARLVEYAVKKKWPILSTVKETGSGMNSTRPKLLKLLRDTKITTIVVEHRERLVRMGFEPLEAALAASGRKIHVIEETELSDDLVRDMTEVLTSFCARLYGRRAARRRASAAIEAAARPPALDDDEAAPE